ncbi:nucleotidyltransferase domain-containing protein [Actinopolymorpha sp. NPDC004070]|uniref:aminoglycoside 6-adenylyltransferase n=1 Tax=Actinopolymorpha sp. NPDC004070 TaxID=3154548 RepID=UPI0033BE54C3
MSIPAALAPLPAGYAELYRRLYHVVDADERIRAMWLSGSLARGDADAGSDLDVLLAVRDDDFDAFAGSWREWLGTVTPTLIARALPFAAGAFYVTTADCLRLDVVTERVSGLGETPHRHRLAVLDRDGLDATVPAPGPGRGPDTEQMARLVEEFFRQQAIFPAMVARGDWLCVCVGVQQAQQMLYDLFVQANQPLPPMGIKRWSAKLTPEQRAVLERLPAPSPSNPASAITAMRATALAWRFVGKATLVAAGVPWPAELDRAVGAYVDREVPSFLAAASAPPDARPG